MKDDRAICKAIDNRTPYRDLESQDTSSMESFLEKTAALLPQRAERTKDLMTVQYNYLRGKRAFLASPITKVIILAAFIYVLTTSFVPISESPIGSTYPSGFDMKQSWGSFSPFFDSGSPFSGIDHQSPGTGLNGLPQQCKFEQVHVLHRHAERYPTPGQCRNMQKLADKLKTMTEPPAEQLQWLDQWEYTLGSDLLVATGTATEFTSGAHFWATHGRFLFNATQKGYLFYDPVLNVYDNGTARPVPVLRATSQSRIKTSARSWAAGFFGTFGDDPARSADTESETITSNNQEVYKLVLQEEGPGKNNTLAGYFSCPNANNASYVSGNQRMLAWANVYMVDAAKRFQKLLPGFQNFTAVDAFYMQQFCTHETAAYGTLSPFCSYFTEQEWRGFEYAADLNFFGSASYGCAVGAAEGAGWLYELLARLERKLINVPQNGVNVSFTSSEDVFPLDQRLYLDMSHDSVIVSVLTALGLDALKEDLPSDKLLSPRQFDISRLTPFGARLYVEIISCEGDDDELTVRLKLNNRILPLAGLKYCPSSNRDGLCPYDKFAASIKYALEQVDFDQTCYGVPKGW